MKYNNTSFVQYTESYMQSCFWDIFFKNVFIEPNASIKKIKTGCMVFTSQ